MVTTGSTSNTLLFIVIASIHSLRPHAYYVLKISIECPLQGKVRVRYWSSPYLPQLLKSRCLFTCFFFINSIRFRLCCTLSTVCDVSQIGFPNFTPTIHAFGENMRIRLTVVVRFFSRSSFIIVFFFFESKKHGSKCHKRLRHCRKLKWESSCRHVSPRPIQWISTQCLANTFFAVSFTLRAQYWTTAVSFVSLADKKNLAVRAFSVEIY